ncbi:unnamed protein product [Calicophoron daubneyi]|uniref:Uncharacterized protein n=1 Tax=Calicophoron daubneyi TaxID=300641 RepID=A0AAV2TWT0_CALDB
MYNYNRSPYSPQRYPSSDQIPGTGLLSQIPSPMSPYPNFPGYAPQGPPLFGSPSYPQRFPEPFISGQQRFGFSPRMDLLSPTGMQHQPGRSSLGQFYGQIGPAAHSVSPRQGSPYRSYSRMNSSSFIGTESSSSSLSTSWDMWGSGATMSSTFRSSPSFSDRRSSFRRTNDGRAQGDWISRSLADPWADLEIHKAPLGGGGLVTTSFVQRHTVLFAPCERHDKADVSEDLCTESELGVSQPKRPSLNSPADSTIPSFG